MLETRPDLGTPLVSVDDPLFGRLFRLRVGDYRVIYAFRRAERRVVLLAVGHRRSVYRDLTD